MMSPFEQLFNQTIDIFGVPASFQYAKTKEIVSGIKVGISTYGGADPDLINTVAVGQRVITVKASDLEDSPSKFDVYVINGEKLTIDTVTNVYEPNSGKLLGYKNYVRIA
jgi:hypothetical protein